MQLEHEITSEDDLVEKIQQGDERAASLLLKHYSPRIDFLVRNGTRTGSEDWRDLAMMIKGIVLVKIRDGEFQSSKGTINAFIMGVTRNQLRKYWRDKKPTNVDLAEVPESLLQTSTDSRLESEELKEAIREIIQSIPEVHRRIFQLTYFEGLTPSEIGKRLRLHPQKVSEKLHYAHQLVRNGLVQKGIFQDYARSG